MKKKKKKRTLMDQLTGIILVFFAVGVVFMTGVVIKEKVSSKKSTEQTGIVSGSSVSGSAADEDEEFDERYVTRYSSAVSGKDKDHSGSVFSLELNEKEGKYREYLLSDGNKSVIDKGTFKRTDKGIETINKNEVKNILYFEGDYIISKNALFNGKVPKGKTFSKIFTNDSDGSSNVVINFKKNGKFSQTIVRKGASLDGKDTKNEAEGTYKRKGNRISRTKEDGTSMMTLYIYKNRICTTYYKLEKEASV